jgi:hypothetical protein
MRSRTTAVTARGDDVNPEAGLSAAGSVRAAVVRGEEFNVLVKFPAINLVLDSVVGKMHVVVEVRQVVIACPAVDLVLITTGPAVAVGAVAIVLLQEFLVLALEVLFEDDAPDLKVRVLVSKASFFLSKRCIQIRVVVDLP